MSIVLGIDTSNYTTSAAIYVSENNIMLQQKQLLPVKDGELGLRQSDAVFHHTRQLPDIMDELLSQTDDRLTAVAASERPSQAEGSYMPCFLSGFGSARQIAAVMHLPLYRYTHQQGHVAAAAYGSDHTELLEKEFIAFHVSGGTTDALIVRPDKNQMIYCQRVSGSLDLKAGQLVDRVGLMLGLAFPAGPALEALALTAEGLYSPKPVLRDGWCSLSGIENQCRDLLASGEPKAEIALFCLMSVLSAVDEMTSSLLVKYPKRPLLYAGGVMSNTIIRSHIENRFGGYFAPPEYSSDNAAGIALLASIQTGRRS
ncbi:MAG TPA: peptidase M22 [Ruminococcaceae bacterium]|nr:peptidase M22 [Oscillospiraceae bacterium]HCA28300.1 peptidase M22 [Oscillospiraceae bacterium]